MAAMTIFLILGFVSLLKGAEWLVEGGCSLAKRLGFSQLMIGLTLVSFGTSMPEFSINAISRLSGDADMTLGDIFGSNIANILLILGSAAIVNPLSLKKSTVQWEIPFALAISVISILLAAGDSFPGLTRADGLVLLTCFSLFLFYIYYLGKKGEEPALKLPLEECSLPRSVGMMIAGVLALALGAKGVVTGGAAIAIGLGVQESVVGLTIVALGTSLPELATSLIAAMKKRSDIAVGNVVGSNIFNLCWVLGVSAVVSPLRIPRAYFADMGAIIGATLLLLVILFLGKRETLGRGKGVLFVLLYAVYVGSLFLRNTGS